MNLRSETLAAMQRALPIALIATPRVAFLTCRAEEHALSVADRHLEIDHLPVVEGDGSSERIVGLFDAYRFRCAPADKRVGDKYATLREEHLIGADAAILDFIRSADVHSCRLLVSGTSISGLVTLSDLQDLPVRASLFSMVTQLEMTMREAIEREFPVGDEWMARLSTGRRDKLQQEMDHAKASDTFAGALMLTQFGDKVDIIRKSATFAWSVQKFKDDMRAAQKLRDNLAHANHYASSRAEAMKVSGTVRNMHEWIRHLSSASDHEPGTTGV